jgi:hypothetical protein
MPVGNTFGNISVADGWGVLPDVVSLKVRAGFDIRKVSVPWVHILCLVQTRRSDVLALLHLIAPLST